MNSHTDALLKEAVRFHGHMGPFLVLGFKMGLLAKKILNCDPFTATAEIHTGKRPPSSCILDGIQFTSGCTLGKGNIRLEEDTDIYGIFKSSQTVTIRVRPQIVEGIAAAREETLEEYAHDLFLKKEEELFDVVL